MTASHTQPPALTADDLRRLQNLHLIGELVETAPVQASMQRLHLHGLVSIAPNGKQRSRLTDAGIYAITQIIKQRNNQ